VPSRRRLPLTGGAAVLCKLKRWLSFDPHPPFAQPDGWSLSNICIPLLHALERMLESEKPLMHVAFYRVRLNETNMHQLTF